MRVVGQRGHMWQVEAHALLLRLALGCQCKLHKRGSKHEMCLMAGSVLFSFLLAEGRDFHAYSLSDRDYLSTTTMDNETAFIMSNIAGISPGCRVCDPFCGSGGILLTGALPSPALASISASLCRL